MKSGNVSLEEIARDDAPEQERSFLDWAILFSARRKFIGWFTLGLSALAVIIIFLLPRQYTAETILLPPNQNSSMSSALLGQLGNSPALASLAGSTLGIKNPGDMYVALFRTEPVENAVIQRFGLMVRYHKKRLSEARRTFEKRAAVVLGTKDGLIHISVTDRDPNMASQIANDYVDEFRNLSAHLAITEAAQRRAFFQQQMLEANGDLVGAENSMKSMEESTGILQIDSQARALVESAAALRAQLVAKEVQLQSLRTYGTEDNPQIVTAEQELEALKAQLAQLGGKQKNASSDVIVPKGNIPSAQVEYLRKMRDLRYEETVVEILTKQFEMAKLDEAREGAIIQVAQMASPPDKQSFPKPLILCPIAVVLSFVLACGLCVLMDSFESMKSDHEARQKLEALQAMYGGSRLDH